MMKNIKRPWSLKRALALLLAGVMIVSQGGPLGMDQMAQVQAAEEETTEETIEVTSLAYYDPAEATVTADGIDEASFGFVAPLVNGKTYKELNLTQVWDDIAVEARQTDGSWTNVDQSVNPDSIYTWNVDWGFTLGDNWDNYVFWFTLDESTDIRVRSISHPDQYLEYHLVFNQMERQTITSISTTESNQNATATGESSIHFDQLTINGKRPTKFVEYQQIEDDLEMLVDNKDGKGFVPLSANPDSGFIWGQNFGMWYEGAGGIYFKGVYNSFTVRFQSKSNPSVGCEFNVNYSEPVRANYTLSTTGPGDAVVTNLDANAAANNAASVGIVLPYIGGESVYQTDLEKFVYEIQTEDGWVNLADANSGWVYQGNGYSKYSDKQQWGYFGDYVWGLWFQPVLTDTVIRVGYPENGVKGGAINNNYITYTIIGNENGVVPDVADMVDIEVDHSEENPTNTNVTDADITVPEGWEMIWHDEFNGSSLDSNNWANQTGFLLLEDDITTAGWGNNELEWYTDSPKNTSVGEGKLKLTMLPEEKDFYSTDGQKATARYSSGKILTKDKFSVKYGRIDFRAKLPAGTGIWPAMWMMPNDDIYGTWAASGEIDVFEGKGRVPELVYGTLHYGNMSPGNKNTGDFINIVENGNVKSDFTNWHVYSVVWEEGNIKMYADGKCYFKCTSETFFSGGAGGNVNAPFDQRFYLIINLAAGGWFDGGTVPSADFEKAEMFVDYVRVYQKPVGEEEDEKPDSTELEESGKTHGNISVGKDDNLYGDYHIGTVIPLERMNLDKTSISIQAGLSEKITPTFEPSNATNKNIIWTSSNPEVATVTGGTVKALKPGNTTITAAAADGNITKTCEVEVLGVEVSSVSLTPETLELTVDEQAKLSASVLPEGSNPNVAFTSSDSKVVTVDENGYVRAVKAGTATITATAEGTEISDTCEITVKAAPPVLVQNVTIQNGDDESGEVTLEAGSEVTLTAVVSPENATNKNVTWTSGNEEVATVNNGKVTAVAEGNTTITVTTEDGSYTDTWNIIVTKKSAERADYGVVRDGNDVILYYKSAAEVAYYTWLNSEDEEIIENQVPAASNPNSPIVQNGEYYEFTISDCVEGNEDKYIACWFNRTNMNKIIMKISDIPVVETEGENPTTVSVNSIAITNAPTEDLAVGDTLTLRATVLPYDATDRTVTWTSSAPDIAEVDANGKVTAKAAGEVRIIVTSNVDTEKTASCTINVVAAKASYDVNFIVNDEPISSQKVTEGEKAVRPSDPVVKGYTFDGWYVGETEFDFDSTIEANTDVVAKLSPVKVSRIQMTSNLTLEVGKKTTIIPTVTPGDALDKSVTWSTDSDKVTVDTQTGEITAVSPGSAVISATAKDGSNVAATCNVTVIEATEDKALYTVDFVVNGSTISSQKITEGEKVAKPADPSVEGYTFDGWYDGEALFDFNSPIKKYTKLVAKLTANQSGDDQGNDNQGNNNQGNGNQDNNNSGNGNQGNNSGNNKVPVTKNYTVTFDCAGGSTVNAQTVKAGAKATAPAAPTKAGYEFIGWYNGSSVYNFDAAVNSNLTLTAKWQEIKVSKIKITGISKKIAVTKKIQMTANVTPENALNTNVKWSVDKKKYASVNQKGVVKFKKAGKNKTVKVTATALDGSGVKATYKIKIMPKAVKKITLKAAKTTVKAGKKVQVKATVAPSSKVNKTLQWSSSNTEYATVNKKGVVTTKKAGKGKKVKITAKATDGSNKKKTITIKIK